VDPILCGESPPRIAAGWKNSRTAEYWFRKQPSTHGEYGDGHFFSGTLKDHGIELLDAARDFGHSMKAPETFSRRL